MRRRTFIRDTLSAAGLVIAPGVIDSAARLDPVDTPRRLARHARSPTSRPASTLAHWSTRPCPPSTSYPRCCGTTWPLSMS